MFLLIRTDVNVPARGRYFGDGLYHHDGPEVRSGFPPDAIAKTESHRSEPQASPSYAPIVSQIGSLRATVPMEKSRPKERPKERTRESPMSFHKNYKTKAAWASIITTGLCAQLQYDPMPSSRQWSRMSKGLSPLHEEGCHARHSAFDFKKNYRSNSVLF